MRDIALSSTPSGILRVCAVAEHIVFIGAGITGRFPLPHVLSILDKLLCLVISNMLTLQVTGTKPACLLDRPAENDQLLCLDYVAWTVEDCECGGLRCFSCYHPNFLITSKHLVSTYQTYVSILCVFTGPSSSIFSDGNAAIWLPVIHLLPSRPL